MEFRFVVSTDHFDETVAFLSGPCGLSIDHEWGIDDHEGVRGAVFVAADGFLEVCEGPTSPSASGIHVAIEVDDVDAQLRRLLEWDVVAGSPAIMPWGHRVLAVKDPNGVDVVFFEKISQ